MMKMLYKLLKKYEKFYLNKNNLK